MRIGSLIATTTAGLLLLTACGGGPGSVSTGGGGAQAGSGAPAPADSHDRRACPEGQELFAESDDVEEAPIDESARFPWEVSDPAVLEDFDLSRVISGGPPPDGIPSIDAPCFESVESADRWLEGRSPVLSLEHEGWHAPIRCRS